MANELRIMHDESRIVDIIRDRQCAMRREMDRRGILMKVVAQDCGISYSALLTYFPADADKTPAQIPGSVIFALTGHLPADIMSTLLPAGHVIVQVPEEIDHDSIAEWTEAYTAKKLAAHRADSECQEQIGPNEKLALDSIVVAFPGTVAA